MTTLYVLYSVAYTNDDEINISNTNMVLEVPVLALTLIQEEASTFGLQMNWSKTKILQVSYSSSSSTVQVADRHVKVVDAFVYLGCMIDSSGGSRGEVLRRIGLARSCMNMLERRIWKSSIRLETRYAAIRHTLCQF